MNLALEIRVGKQKVWVVLAEVFFSLPGGFLLGMVATLNFAKLDDSAASNSAGKLENLEWLLFISQITV